jgi:hypothetical protein
MIHWSDRYLGIPYAVADCAQLAERVRREVFGQDMRLPTERASGTFGRSAQIGAHLSEYAARTDAPRDGDGVLLYAHGRLQHIGLWCVIGDEPWVLHTVEGQGAHRLRLRDLARAGYRLEGVYRWR